MRKLSAFGHRRLWAGSLALLSAMWWGCAAPSSRLWAENGPIIQPEPRASASGSASLGPLAKRDVARAATDDGLN